MFDLSGVMSERNINSKLCAKTHDRSWIYPCVIICTLEQGPYLDGDGDIFGSSRLDRASFATSYFIIWCCSGYQCEVTLTHKTCIGINKDLMSNQHGVFFLVSRSVQGTQKAVTVNNLGRKRCCANVHGFAMTFEGNRWPRVVSWTVVMLESRLTLQV